MHEPRRCALPHAFTDLSRAALAMPVLLVTLTLGDMATAQEAPRASCKMGSDGRQTCGFHCKMGSDGHVACADTPDGTCAMSSDGTVVCTELQGSRFAPIGGVRSECKMGSDGHVVCGFVCRMGSDGRVACADTPSGACAMGSDGHVVCSRLLGAPAARDPGARAQCKMGSDGHVVCGFVCKMGSDGHVACADSPDGACAMGSDGHVVCTEERPPPGRRSNHGRREQARQTTSPSLDRGGQLA
ncbi:MAG: hypothetical protein ABIJ09_12725 [Pseudomonadota bacterium]